MNELSGLQRFIRWFVSEATFAAMQAESQQWMMKCSNCDHEKSIWSLGGIRYKGAGSPRTIRTCTNCSQRSIHIIYKKQA